MGGDRGIQGKRRRLLVAASFGAAALFAAEPALAQLPTADATATSAPIGTVTQSPPVVAVVAPAAPVGGQGASPVTQAATPVAQAASSAVAPVAAAAAPAVEAVAPVVEPVAQTAAPVVRAAQPVSETVTPVLEEAQPVLDTAAAVVGVAEPVAEPVAEATSPVLETLRPVVEPTSSLSEGVTGAPLAKGSFPGGTSKGEEPMTSPAAPPTQLEAGVSEAASSASVSTGESATAGRASSELRQAQGVRGERRPATPPTFLAWAPTRDILAPTHLGAPRADRNANATVPRRAPARPFGPLGLLAAVSAGFASGGSSVFAVVIAAALLLAAPGLGRWLRPGKASWPLPIPLASLERPG